MSSFVPDNSSGRSRLCGSWQISECRFCGAGWLYVLRQTCVVELSWNGIVRGITTSACRLRRRHLPKGSQLYSQNTEIDDAVREKSRTWRGWATEAREGEDFMSPFLPCSPEMREIFSRRLPRRRRRTSAVAVKISTGDHETGYCMRTAAPRGGHASAEGEVGGEKRNIRRGRHGGTYPRRRTQCRRMHDMPTFLAKVIRNAAVGRRSSGRERLAGWRWSSGRKIWVIWAAC